MIYEELATGLLEGVKNGDSKFIWVERFGFTYRKNYEGDMAKPHNDKVVQKQGYFDFVINAGSWGSINHHKFLEEILKDSSIEACEEVWAGKAPFDIAETRKERELLITLTLLMFEQEVNWGNEVWQRKSNFSPDFNTPFLQRPRDMLMGFINMAFTYNSVDAIPHWRYRNDVKSSPTFKKRFRDYDTSFKSHFTQYQNDERALPLMHSFRENFLEVLEGTKDNPNYTPPSLCITCNRELSTKVVDYCTKNERRFEGKLYCFNHQKIVK
ncbi:RING finger protein [Planococcus wigleyi]|uniref:Uncharacterized protein n=1 Tax=Planococcus wigleyi TaxID=2762216 RepID=A0ABR8WBT6_9BACL|nr:hypothetical protein [Planococcus wigleyi]MBD8014493.1 hypothetical protein [Planococcus wigleyi]